MLDERVGRRVGLADPGLDLWSSVHPVVMVETSQLIETGAFAPTLSEQPL